MPMEFKSMEDCKKALSELDDSPCGFSEEFRGLRCPVSVTLRRLSCGHDPDTVIHAALAYLLQNGHMSDESMKIYEQSLHELHWGRNGLAAQHRDQAAESLYDGDSPEAVEERNARIERAKQTQLPIIAAKNDMRTSLIAIIDAACMSDHQAH